MRGTGSPARSIPFSSTVLTSHIPGALTMTGTVDDLVATFVVPFNGYLQRAFVGCDSVAETGTVTSHKVEVYVAPNSGTAVLKNASGGDAVQATPATDTNPISAELTLTPRPVKVNKGDVITLKLKVVGGTSMVYQEFTCSVLIQPSGTY